MGCHPWLGVEQIGVLDLHRNNPTAGQLENQPTLPVAAVDMSRAQCLASQRMARSDDPHLRRQPAPDMVQCEPRIFENRSYLIGASIL